MYPVSEAFLRAVQENTRNFYWTGKITTKGNQTYEFGPEDIVKGSGYISRQCCGGTEIELGTVYAAEMGISLFSDVDRYTLEDAEVRLYFHLYLEDGSVETVPMGIFDVSEANRSIKTLELKGYDRMLRFDEPLKLDAAGGTAYNFLYAACTACKVEPAQTKAEIDALPNGRETLGIYAENDMETYRDLLHYVAQVLGCVCQINREGKLLLIPYKNTADISVPARERFSSSYSDFVTRYTAVSSTNRIREIAEYYAIQPDDGLTMNLETNPLLQFGLQATREKILNGILGSITHMEYVPFDGTTIGNPALEPMDVLRFTGGHADEDRLSCITSIEYKINGKMSLKCVGKNPRLAAAKSKNDKNITGLLNQVESGKTVVYSFMNVSPYTIGSSPTMVLDITFTSKEATSAMFLGEFLLDVRADDVERTLDGTAFYEEERNAEGEGEEPPQETVSVEKLVRYRFTEKCRPELTVSYRLNGETVETFVPKKTCVDGSHILTLFFPLPNVIENSENTFEVYLSVIGGTAAIGELQIRATISGQGLVAGIGDWNGRISVTETVDGISVDGRFGYIALSDSAAAAFPEISPMNLTQGIGLPKIDSASFGYDALNERVTAVETVRTFTLDGDFPPVYDLTKAELSEDGAFRLISDWAVVSAEEDINSGRLQHLAIDTLQYETVESMEVETC